MQFVQSHPAFNDTIDSLKVKTSPTMPSFVGRTTYRILSRLMTISENMAKLSYSTRNPCSQSKGTSCTSDTSLGCPWQTRSGTMMKRILRY